MTTDSVTETNQFFVVVRFIDFDIRVRKKLGKISELLEGIFVHVSCTIIIFLLPRWKFKNLTPASLQPALASGSQSCLVVV